MEEKREFTIIGESAQALIRCDCGEYLSLVSDRPAELCPGCPRRYHVSVRVEFVLESEAELTTA